METLAKKLLLRITKAKEKKLIREGELQEAYRYVLPIRDTINNKEGVVERGVKFDPTATNAIEKYATKLQNLLTPAWEEWLKLQPGVDIPEEEAGKLQEALDKASDVAFSHIHHSNFYTAEHEAFLDLGISTGGMIVERNTRKNEPSLINCRSIPLAEIIPECSSRGSIDTVWREFKPKVREIPYIWPNAQIPQELKEKSDQDEHMAVEVYEGVVFNEETSDYTMYVIEKSLNAIMYEEQMETSPFIIFRESVRPGDSLGFGRALRILEDIKSLNKMAENQLRADSLRSMPFFTGVDGGFNPYTFSAQPGAVNLVESNDNANPSLRAFQVGGDYIYEENRMNALKATVNETFLANPFGQIDQTPVRSATEIAAREADLFQSTAAAFGRLQTEFLEKFMRRVVDILNKEGALPPLKVNGRQVAIKFTSPFAKMQGSEKVKNTMQYLSYILPLGKEVVAMSVNMDKIPANIAKNMGIDKELYKDATEVDQTKEQMAAMAQQAAMAGADIPMGGTQPQEQPMPLI